MEFQQFNYGLLEVLRFHQSKVQTQAFIRDVDFITVWKLYQQNFWCWWILGWNELRVNKRLNSETKLNFPVTHPSWPITIVLFYFDLDNRVFEGKLSVSLILFHAWFVVMLYLSFGLYNRLPSGCLTMTAILRLMILSYLKSWMCCWSKAWPML